MKTLEITVKENKKINYTHILEIESMISDIKDVSIINNKIIFITQYSKVTINNFKNCNDVLLNSIIQKLIIIKIKKRKANLRKRKIKRTKTFAIALVMSLGILGTDYIISESKNIVTPELEQKIEIANNNIIQTPVKDEKIEYIENDENDKILIEIPFESRIESEKFKTTKAFYQDIITRISSCYGIDPQIMLAIATQECGVHNINANTPAIGLMQIEKAVWNNQNITAYNYNLGTYETYNISVENLKDLEFNIRVACMYFQNCLKSSNYNLEVAIQMYNFGYSNVENTFKIYHNQDITLKYALDNYNNGWLECRENILAGDKLYLEHVLSYIESPEELSCKKGTEEIKYSIKSISKGMTKI